MSSKLEDKFYEDVEKVIDDVKEELRYVMAVNHDPEHMIHHLGVELRHATKEVKKIQNKYEL